MNIEYLYVDPLNPPQGYIDMLREYHGEEKWNRFKKKQFEWYQQYPLYKIYAVKVDGVFAGQATAFGVDIYNDNKIKKLWWSVDTFLFEKYRGGGKGKQLQKQLHVDLPNFTSAAYTPINGIIKKKCGGKAIFQKTVGYYGVSNFFTLMASIAAERKLKVKLPHHGLPLNVYMNFRRKRYNKYRIGKAVINNALVDFINSTLQSRYDFFVWRTLEYMQWKYEQNPAFNYNLIQFSRNGKTEAIVGFTDVHEYSIGGKFVRSVKILDSVIAQDSQLADTDLLMYVADFFKKKGQKIEGIFSLIKTDWQPRIGVSRPVLSTLMSEVKKPYLTYLDQDMEQEM